MNLRNMLTAHDVTSGRPWKRILELMIPLLLGNIAQQLYNTVDTIVVGKYVGDDALSAVGAAGPIVNFLFVLFMGIATGAGILVSQRFGAKDREGLSLAIGNCLSLTLFISIVTTALGLFVTRVPLFHGRDLLQVMNTPEGNIYTWSRQYLTVIFAGVSGTIFYNICAGCMRALGDSVSALLFLLLACGLNIGLDLWFVRGLGLGVFGVALATIIAQVISGTACLIRLMNMKNFFTVTKKELKLQRQIVKRMLDLGIPSGITQGIFSLSSIFVQSLTNSMGPVVMASSIVVMRIDGFAIMPYFSLGNAMTTFSGQNFGGKKLERLETGSRQAIIMAFIMSFSLTGAILLFGRQLAGLFTKTPELIEIAMSNLKILSVAYLVQGMNQALSGYLRGTGNTKVPMIVSIVTQVIIRVPLAYLLANLTRTEEFPHGQATAIYLSLAAAWFMGAILTLFFYRRSRKKLRAGADDSWQKTAAEE